MGSKNVNKPVNHEGISPCGLEGVPCLCCKYESPVKVETLLPLLEQYPNKKAAKLLADGFQFGFRLGFIGERMGMDAPNLKSISQMEDKAMEKINKEVKLGRIAGPFKTKPLPNLRISPIGLVPKAEPGKVRMIHHLSYPRGDSLNDGIDRAYCSVQYTQFDEAVHTVVGVGQGALMAKKDIESAFRLLPVHPSDFDLLGMKLGDSYYVDKALPMGASCSPALFETFSTFLEWAARSAAASDNIVHFADDYLLAGRDDDSNMSCARLVRVFEQVCEHLGVPLAEEKSIAPTTKIVYLGIQIDSIRQSLSIPQEKLERIVAKIESALQATKLSLKEIQSLIGSLSFVCRVVAPGRPFIRRLIDLSCGLKVGWHKTRLTEGVRSDLRMWLVFLRQYNGVSIIPDQRWLGAEDIELYTDASGGIGFGGYLQGEWFQGKWPQNLNQGQRSIAWLELFPIVVAVVLWGDRLRGKRIVLRSDNEGVVIILNKQTSRCPEIMKLVRFLVLQCLKVNLAFTAKHIPGKLNNIADALSRFQMPRFWKEAPTAKASGLPVPAFLWQL